MNSITKYGVRPVEVYFQASPDNPQVLRVKRKSDFSGKDNQMDLPITEDHLRQWLTTTNLIQHVMPHLSSEQREFLISGCSPEEWAELVKEED